MAVFCISWEAAPSAGRVPSSAEAAKTAQLATSTANLYLTLEIVRNATLVIL